MNNFLKLILFLNIVSIILIIGCKPLTEPSNNVDITGLEMTSTTSDIKDETEVNLPPDDVLHLITNDFLYFTVIPSTKKLSPDSPLTPSNAIYNGTTITLKMAQKEWFSFQVLLLIRGDHFQDTLDLIPEIRFSNIDLNCKFFDARFINVISPSELIGRAGTFADPLIPVSQITISKSQNTVLWITCKVPSDAGPGQYSGQLTLSDQGNQIVSKNIDLKVWNFALYDEPSLPAIYQIDETDLIAEMHGIQPEFAKPLIENYAEYLLNYRMYPTILSSESISIGDAPLFAGCGENGASFNFTSSDDWLNYILDEKRVGIFRLSLPLELIRDVGTGDAQINYDQNQRTEDYLNGDVISNTEFAKCFKSILQTLVEHYNSLGVLDKSYLFIDSLEEYSKVYNQNNQLIQINYISDEPYNQHKNGYDEFRYFGKLIKEVEESTQLTINYTMAAPLYTRKGWRGQNSINNLADDHVEGNARTINEYIDGIDDSSDFIAQLSNVNVNIVPNSFCDNIDFPGLYHRGLGFFAFKYNLKAVEQWDVFAWYGDDIDPWQNKLPNVYGLGAGVMLYPGSHFGINGPIGSVRTEINRDSLEDHDYLQYLFVLSSNREYVKQIAQRPIPSHYKEMILDHNLFQHQKNFIGDEIERFTQGDTLLPSKLVGSIIDAETNLPIVGAIIISDYFATQTNSQGQFLIYYKNPNTTFEISAFPYISQIIRLSDYPPGSSPIISLIKRNKRVLNTDQHFFGDVLGDNGVELNNIPDEDWSRYQYLAFDVYNNELLPAQVEVVLVSLKNPITLQNDGWTERETTHLMLEKGLRLLALPRDPNSSNYRKTILRIPVANINRDGKWGFLWRNAVGHADPKVLIIRLDNRFVDPDGFYDIYFTNVRLIE